MNVCLMIEGQDGPSWESWLEIALCCEAAGIEALFRSDHYAPINAAADADALDAWTTVAGLAASTNKLRLGVLVSPVTFRHPSVLAKVVTTCDHLSGGRIEVGLGAGWYSTEHERFGFEFPDTASRMRMLGEQLEIVTRMWRGEPFDFEGEFYQLRNCIARPLPLRRPHPRIIVGGKGGRRTIELAVEWADEYNTVFAKVEDCEAIRQRLDTACEVKNRSKNTLSLSLMTGFILGDDKRDVSKKADSLAGMIGFGDGESFLKSVRDTWIVGTPEEVVVRLSRYAEAGVERVMLQHLMFDDLDTIEKIGREISPAVKHY